MSIFTETGQSTGDQVERNSHVCKSKMIFDAWNHYYYIHIYIKLKFNSQRSYYVPPIYAYILPVCNIPTGS